MKVEPLKLEEHVSVMPIVNEVEDKKKKKANLWERIFKKHKLKKPTKVAVLYLRNNGTAEPLHLETKEGFFSINGRTYHERRDCLYRLGKERIPLAVIREWDLIPIGTRKFEDDDMRYKFSELQDHVLKGIRHAELVKLEGRDKGSPNMKWIIGGGIALLIGFALYKQYFGGP